MAVRLLTQILSGILLLCSIPADAQSIFTYAGGGSDDGKPAQLVGLDPQDVGVDGSGNVYITDRRNHFVRRLEPDSGLLHVYAGNGTTGDSGDGGPATEAAIGEPFGLAVANDGTIYVWPQGKLPRRIDPSTGIIESYPGCPADRGVVTSGGDLLLACWGGYDPAMVLVSGTDRTVTPISWNHGRVMDFANASDGKVLVRTSSEVYKLDPVLNSISRIAGGGSIVPAIDQPVAALDARLQSGGIARDAQGRIFLGDLLRVLVLDNDGIIHHVSGKQDYQAVPTDEPVPIAEGRYHSTVSLTMRSDNELLVADGASLRVKMLDFETGLVTTLAGNGILSWVGDGVPATSARLSNPEGVAIDAVGNLVFADLVNNRLRKVNRQSGEISTILGDGRFGDQGDGGPAANAITNSPKPITVDRNGNIYFAGGFAKRLRRIDAVTGIVDTVQASQCEIGGITADAENRIYFTTRTPCNRLMRLDPDNKSAEMIALITDPFGLAADQNMLLVASGCKLISFDPETSSETVLAGGEVCGSSGDGGPATSAALDPQFGVAVENDGDILLGQVARIRRIDAATGVIDTIIGNGTLGYAGDGGPAIQASFSPGAGGAQVSLRGIAVGEEGEIFISDHHNNRIRVVRPCTAVAEPILQSPADGTSGLGLSPSLSWSEAPGALRYDVYVDTSIPPRKLIASDVETSTFSLMNLEPLTTYYWKIVAKGDPFCHPFRAAESQVRSFTTRSECEIPRPATRRD